MVGFFCKPTISLPSSSKEHKKTPFSLPPPTERPQGWQSPVERDEEKAAINEVEAECLASYQSNFISLHCTLRSNGLEFCTMPLFQWLATCSLSGSRWKKPALRDFCWLTAWKTVRTSRVVWCSISAFSFRIMETSIWRCFKGFQTPDSLCLHITLT